MFVGKKSFVNKLVLAKHRDSVHAIDRAYKCDFCQHTFKSEIDLKCHKAFHLKEPKFKCKFCGHKYHREIEWRGHTYTHRGHKPYKCESCEAKFCSCQQLHEHTGLHQGDFIDSSLESNFESTYKYMSKPKCFQS